MDYGMTNPGTPGWQFAPVPGWGMNPAAAGPARVGVGLSAEHATQVDLMPPQASANGMGCPCLGVGAETRVATDVETQYRQTSWGMLAAVAAGALAMGVFLGYAAGKRAKVTPNPRPRRRSRGGRPRGRAARRNPRKKKGFDQLQQDWRQEPGTKMYIFEWQGGGYNTVHAKSKQQAARRARQLGGAIVGGRRLRYAESSAQPWTYERERRYSAGWD
jgi:hypothetical protein